MKKIKLILTSVALVAAFSFAYANSDVKRLDYFYYPGGDETGTPVAAPNTPECTILNQRGCFVTIQGESAQRQLFVQSGSDYIPVNKP